MKGIDLLIHTGCLKKTELWIVGLTSHLSPSISSDGLEIFFIYPTWVKENCKIFSDQNTVWNMVKIHFEKYEKVENQKSRLKKVCDATGCL